MAALSTAAVCGSRRVFSTASVVSSIFRVGLTRSGVAPAQIRFGSSATGSGGAADTQVAKLLQRLREAAESDGGIDPAVGADADAVLRGDKRALGPDSSFSFACTACGECCRSYVDSIMLDCYDVFMMSRSPAVAAAATAVTPNKRTPQGTVALHSAYGQALLRRLGSFETASLIDAPSVGDSHPFPPKYTSGLAPVLFLRSRDADDATAPGACYFAEPHDHSPGAPAEYADGGTGPSSQDRSQGEGGLRCTLGRQHMPTTCQLYPLGELLSERVRPTDSAKPVAVRSAIGSWDDADLRHFFSLDTRCEGVGPPVGDNPDLKHFITVAEYRSRSTSLSYRRVQWEWFLSLATRFAAQRYDARLVRVLHESRSAHKRRRRGRRGQPSFSADDAITVINDLVFRLWYDFDSLPAAEGRGLRWASEDEWEVARGHIERGTMVLAAEVDRFIEHAEIESRSRRGRSRRGGPAPWERGMGNTAREAHAPSHSLPWWFPLFEEMHARIVAAGVSPPLWAM